MNKEITLAPCPICNLDYSSIIIIDTDSKTETFYCKKCFNDIVLLAPCQHSKHTTQKNRSENKKKKKQKRE